MIYVRTSTDPLFNYAECEEMYNACKDKIQDGDFEDIVKNTMFYAFYITQTNELIGCIYYFLNGRKLMLNAFSGRKHHELNLECLKESMNWYKERNIYANAIQPTSRLCLLRCGFERVKGNLFRYRRRNNGRKVKL